MYFTSGRTQTLYARSNVLTSWARRPVCTPVLYAFFTMCLICRLKERRLSITMPRSLTPFIFDRTVSSKFRCCLIICAAFVEGHHVVIGKRYIGSCHLLNEKTTPTNVSAYQLLCITVYFHLRFHVVSVHFNCD